MSSTEDSNSRTVYRLRYPAAASPVVRINGEEYAVSELSEAGMRIVVDVQPPPALKGPLSCEVIFEDQSSETVEGEVIRIDTNAADQVEAILKLTNGISLKRMLSEQVRIRNEYLRMIDSSDGISEPED